MHFILRHIKIQRGAYISEVMSFDYLHYGLLLIFKALDDTLLWEVSKNKWRRDCNIV